MIIIYYNVPIKDIYRKFNSSYNGIKRVGKHKKNLIGEGRKTSPFEILLRQFADALVLILIGAFIITLIVGEKIDAYIIGFIVLFNALLGFFQEYRAEKSVMSLKKMMALKARVIRKGKLIDINSEDILPGDVIILNEGDKVPADARIIECKNLLVDESMLTGESVPVEKTSRVLRGKKLIPEQKNMLFSGTIVVRGNVRAIVVATGKDTEVGNIASEIDADFSMTPLQKELNVFGKKLGIIVLSICAIIFLYYGFVSHSYLRSFMIALSLAVAAVPQALPAVITIALSLGTKRMVRKNALIRRLPAVETLGSVDVICTDKTGTLTLNKMEVKEIYVNHEVHKIASIEKYSMGNDAQSWLFRIGGICNGDYIDPLEKALLEIYEKKADKNYEVIDIIPFDSERKMMSVHVKNGIKKYTFSKGAPDIIIKRCNRIMIHGKIRKITENDRKKIRNNMDMLSRKAYKLIGCAYKEGKFSENNLIFVGIHALIDPPREDIKESIKEAKSAGVKVVMITGDYHMTASAIGREVGIIGKVIEGKEIDDCDNFDDIVDKYTIFARVTPKHKLMIVDALKKKGHIVAMTGDGVNDAPALKKADIGVSFGSGSDVAKESSEMILLDDNFSTIIKAIREGRLIYDNINKFISFLLYSNSVEVAVVLIATLFSFPALPFLYIHLLWINMLTDGLPAISLSLDPPSNDIMKRKPKKNHKIISRRFIIENLLVGSTVTIAILVLFSSYLHYGKAYAQTISFTAMVIYEMIILYIIRKRRNASFFSNPALLFSVILTIILQLIVLYGINNLFKTVPITIYDWAIILVIGIIMYAGILAGMKVLDYVKKVKGHKC